jgi:hypothetical protein
VDRAGFLFFILILNFSKEFKVLSLQIKKCLELPFFLLAGALLFDEKICELFGLFLIVQ